MIEEEQFTCVGCGFDYPESSRNENDEGYCYDCIEGVSDG